ncbi:FG-GAP repeat domain-containing protein [Methylobacter luteus]|uniref:FG-GAP repeat domain-containing protein n=1 Tax=Methylobacter luteus TaxID=415 RepID=UPI0003F96ABD|nr:VCBS repeat-containing protein [Methylobacter luteus]
MDDGVLQLSCIKDEDRPLGIASQEEIFYKIDVIHIGLSFVIELESFVMKTQKIFIPKSPMWRGIASSIMLLGILSCRFAASDESEGFASQESSATFDLEERIEAELPLPTRRICPAEPKPRTIEIREADPEVNRQHHDLMRNRLMAEVAIPNTTILLGPKVILDFSGVSLRDAEGNERPLLDLSACVTLKGTSTFVSGPVVNPVKNARTDDVSGKDNRKTDSAAIELNEFEAFDPMAVARPALSGAFPGREEHPARTPQSLGPLLKFGPHRDVQKGAFLAIRCIPNSQPNDNVRISGFRIHGPSFGQQSVEDSGIKIERCLNIEISNMEIAGWGGQGIVVYDANGQGPGQEQPSNLPGDRIGRPDQVRIFRNYIHHNQHPSNTPVFGHAAGYGVEVDNGAWAQIRENVFDFNRHAIAAGGDAGGYEALRNLVLKGGGYHYAGFHTHQFDIHGTGDNGFDGLASVQSWYTDNAFQYLAGPAIKIRGRPVVGIYIHDNIFAHEGLEDDVGDDAIHVDDRDDLDVIHLGPNNTINFDSYGNYGVCDFDGDSVDDLFLANGRTWWFSSYGEFQWSYLSTRTERLNQIRLGYFDADKRCDVLTESNGQWMISSGGTGSWQSIGAFGATLSEVVFGRFDPNVRDHRPGVTRQTTHAFRRTLNNQWMVTALSAPNWQPIQSSTVAMNKLRFGDFTGDGVTDVLAVRSGRWSISESGRGNWKQLNAFLSDDVSSLLIADLNNNNIDDLIRLEVVASQVNENMVREKFTWMVSDDGRSRWRKLKEYIFTRPATGSIPPAFALAGRFGAAPGGGVLLTDHNRIGHFYSEAEIASGASPDWSSLFAY